MGINGISGGGPINPNNGKEKLPDEPRHGKLIGHDCSVPPGIKLTQETTEISNMFDSIFSNVDQQKQTKPNLSNLQKAKSNLQKAEKSEAILKAQMSEFLLEGKKELPKDMDSREFFDFVHSMHKQRKLIKLDAAGNEVRATDEEFEKFIEVAKKYFQVQADLKSIREQIKKLESHEMEENEEINQSELSSRTLNHVSLKVSAHVLDPRAIENKQKLRLILIQIGQLKLFIVSQRLRERKQKKIEQEILVKIDNIRHEIIAKEDKNKGIQTDRVSKEEMKSLEKKVSIDTENSALKTFIIQIRTYTSGLGKKITIQESTSAYPLGNRKILQMHASVAAS